MRKGTDNYATKFGKVFVETMLEYITYLSILGLRQKSSKIHNKLNSARTVSIFIIIAPKNSAYYSTFGSVANIFVKTVFECIILPIFNLLQELLKNYKNY